MSTDTKAKPQRPTSKTATEREAAIARYGVRGLKQMEGRDGVAFSLTLLRDGKPIARVRDEGRGGETWWEGADGRLLRQNEESTVEVDAVAWFVGSETEKADWGFMKGEVPDGCRDILVEELMRREEERKWLMKETRGAKKVLFQVGADIGGQRWRIYAKVGPDRTAKTVERAKGEGSPVRVVWREGKVLRSEVFGK